MSVLQVRAAYRVRVGSGSAKAVLMLLCDHACDRCGLAWPGVGYICDTTEVSRASVTRALKILEAGGWIRTHGYATGGRGRATEFVVMPGLEGLAVAPCASCRARMVDPARRSGTGPESAAGVIDGLKLFSQGKP